MFIWFVDVQNPDKNKPFHFISFVVSTALEDGTESVKCFGLNETGNERDERDEREREHGGPREGITEN